MEWILISVGAVLIVLGMVGSFLPVLPGPPLSLAGILCMHFSAPENKFSTTGIILFIIITIIVTVLDYIIPAAGTKKFGGSKYGVWGSTIGLIVGLFLGPWGVVIGPFLGALIGELIYGKNSQDALRAAFGAFVGFMLGTGLKFISAAVMAFFFVAKTIAALGRLI